jgi:hypothetical protein
MQHDFYLTRYADALEHASEFTPDIARAWLTADLQQMIARGLTPEQIAAEFAATQAATVADLTRVMDRIAKLLIQPPPRALQ